MNRIAGPMIGGMTTTPLLSLFVIPVIYYIWKLRGLNKPATIPAGEETYKPHV
jgi:copper/silver efflux system protein